MNFDERTDFRLRYVELEQIRNAIINNPDQFDNISHFIRCAIIKLLNEVKKDE